MEKHPGVVSKNQISIPRESKRILEKTPYNSEDKSTNSQPEMELVSLMNSDVAEKKIN